MAGNPKTPAKSRRLSSFHLLDRSPQDVGDETPRAASRVAGDVKRRISLAVQTGTPYTPRAPHSGSTPLTPPGGSGNKTTQKLSRDEVTALYSDTIKLCQDNKINAKNTWSLNLIDYMGMLVRSDDPADPTSSVPRRTSTETNFQLAGVTLDAGVKIYCSRVDSVHSNAFRVLGGLSRTTGGGADNDADDAGSDDEKAPGETKTKRRPRGGATLVSNMATITVKKLTTDLVVDPLFRKMSEAFDEGGAKGMLTNNLLIESSGYILFDSAEKADAGGNADADPADSETYDPEEDAAAFDMPDNLTLCPDFMAFFTMKQTGSEVPSKSVTFVNSNDEPVQPLSTMSFEYDDGDLASGTSFVPPPMPLEDPADDFDDSGSADPDEFQAEHFEAASMGTPRASLAPARGGVDLVEAGVALAADSDYALFDNKALSAWAGPQHWQFRSSALPGAAKSTRSGMSTEGKRPRSKTAMLLDFSADAPKIDFAAEFKPAKSRTANQLSSAVLDGFGERKTTLPEDLHYTAKDLATLFLLPNVCVALDGTTRTVATSAPNGDSESQWYDYDNELDAENFVEDFEPQPPSAEGNDVTSISSHVDTLAGVNLVPQPSKVDRVDISFAKVAKKVDVRRLKSGLWSQLCGGDEDDNKDEEFEINNEDDDSSEQSESARKEAGEASQVSNPEKDIRTGVTQKLTEIVEDLPSFVPAPELIDVSFPYVFICLLHLANEKSLSISAIEGNLDDLIVSRDET